MRASSDRVCLSGFFLCGRRIFWRRRWGWMATRRWRMRFVFWAWAYMWSRRAGDWRFRRACDVVESEDRAEKRVVMCGAEECAAASPARAGQPGWGARGERYYGDAVRRHGCRFQWGRLQPALLRAVSAMWCGSQDRKDCSVAKAHRHFGSQGKQDCLCYQKATACRKRGVLLS